MIDLYTINEKIKSGSFVLPAFQRPFVWTAKQVAELLDSIFEQFPIGVITTWTTNQRILEAETLLKTKKPPKSGDITYILDGQQRLKTIYYSLNEQAYIDMSRDSAHKRKYMDFYYYIDLNYNPDLHDCKFLNFSEIKKRRNHIGELSVFELNKEEKKVIIQTDYQEYNDGDKIIHNVLSKLDIEELNENNRIRFVNVKLLTNNEWLNLLMFKLISDEQISFLGKLSQLAAPDRKLINVNEVPSTIEIDKLADVFGRINRRGQRLSTFDLQVAITYKKGVLNLREAIEELKREEHINQFLLKPDNIIFTQIITMWRYKSLSKKDQLRISTEDCLKLELTKNKIRNARENKAKNLYRDSLSRAIRFLKDHKVQNLKKLRYDRVLHVLTCLYMNLLDPKGELYKIKDEHFFNELFSKLIETWYWRVLFSETFAIGTSVPPKHLIELIKILNNRENLSSNGIKNIPKLLDNFSKCEIKLIEEDIPRLQNTKYRDSIVQLLLYCKPRDFKTGDILITDAIPPMDKLENHHLFPVSLLTKSPYNLDKSNKKIDSNGNITPISKEVNDEIKDKEPSVYLMEYQNNYKKNRKFDSPKEFQEILLSHLIPPIEEWSTIENPLEKYNIFLEKRMKSIRKKIKSLQQDQGEAISEPLPGKEMETSLIADYPFYYEIPKSSRYIFWREVKPKEVQNMMKICFEILNKSTNLNLKEEIRNEWWNQILSKRFSKSSPKSKKSFLLNYSLFFEHLLLWTDDGKPTRNLRWLNKAIDFEEFKERLQFLILTTGQLLRIIDMIQYMQNNEEGYTSKNDWLMKSAKYFSDFGITDEKSKVMDELNRYFPGIFKAFEINILVNETFKKESGFMFDIPKLNDLILSIRTIYEE